MARVTEAKVEKTRRVLIRAARTVLLEQGFSGLSTRRVAEMADTQMSQIRYHFGSKEGLILAVFQDMNAELLKRQTTLFQNKDLTLSEQWDLACDFLEEDLQSGYVRVFQELIAASWSNTSIRTEVVEGLRGWTSMLSDVAGRAAERFGGFGPFAPEEVSALVSAAFIGAEAEILLGIPESEMPLRSALRRIGEVIRWQEERS